MRAATALAGVVLVLVPAAAEPGWAYPAAVAGVVSALVTLWPQHGASAARRARAAIRRGRLAGRPGPAAGARAAADRAGRATAPAGLAHGGTRTADGGTGTADGGTGTADGGTGTADGGTGTADGRVRAAAGTAAAVAAIAGCAVSRLDTAAMAGEGLLLLVFVLLLGRPAGLAGGAVRTWLRLRAPAVLAAIAVTGIVLAALATVPGASPWLALGGLVAAVAAYVVAPSGRRSRGPDPG